MSEPKPPTEEEIFDYLNILLDAAKQRSTDSEAEKCRHTAACIKEIYDILRKYKLSTVDEIVKLLVSLMIIPIQMLEPDPNQRAMLMKQLAIKFTTNILLTELRDKEIRGTESGQELDRLRNMLNDSKIFGE